MGLSVRALLMRSPCMRAVLLVGGMLPATCTEVLPGRVMCKPYSIAPAFTLRLPSEPVVLRLPQTFAPGLHLVCAGQLTLHASCHMRNNVRFDVYEVLKASRNKAERSRPDLQSESSSSELHLIATSE